MEGAILSEMKFDSGSETITAQRVFFPTGGNESGARPMVTIVTQIKQCDVSVGWCACARSVLSEPAG